MTTLSSSFRVSPAFSKHIENWIRSMLRAKFLTFLQCLLALSSGGVMFVIPLRSFDRQLLRLSLCK
jgi:hypothetical protein